MRKGTAKRNIGFVLVAVFLAVVIAANVLTGYYSTMIDLYFRDAGSSKTELNSEEVLKAANAVTEEAEGEGLVMLKNSNGELPLEKGTKINLFGNCAYQTLYQGTGSASSWFKQELNVNLKQGLENAGLEINEGLWKFYEDNYQKRADQEGGMTDMTGADASILEQTMDQYHAYQYESQDILKYSENYSDTAVLVIGRAGGEGADTKMDMTGVNGGDAGKHYLELQDVELQLLKYVEENYDHVIVLLNTATPMECGFIDDDAVEAAFWIGLPGTTGLNAVGKVLTGEINPSGHLVDTYAYDLTTAPSYYNFGDYKYSNYDGNYVHYAEGIYVGYRFYETAAADGFIDYDTTVQFPFGYGLSYTDFDWNVEKVEKGDIGGQIKVDVKVTNVGDTAGKDVVELYYSAPYDPAEKIEKSSVVLGAFAKTGLLDPGASETVTVTLNVDDMASYDYRANGCYVLSAGDYEIKLQSDAHNLKKNSDGSVIEAIPYTVAATRLYNEANGARSTDLVAATNMFDDISAGDGDFNVDSYITRSDWEGTMPKDRADSENMSASPEVIAVMSNGYSGTSIDVEHLPDADPVITGAQNGLAVADMVGLSFDDPKWDKLIDQMSVEDLSKLFGSCGWSNPAILSINKPVGIDMDGAEGLHNLTSDLTGNQYCGSTVRACTWNEDVCNRLGLIYADEAIEGGVSAIYGMSVNTHRSPFGGRNFEYYSEDGLISGKIAAAETRGLQEKNVAVFLKHFCLNDQETNRGTGVRTWANEQAIREIYARPWEIVTEEADCTGYMSSYNYVGACWSGANYNLLTAMPRNEWGFKGRIITDACMDFGIYNPDAGLLAGLDMWLAPMTAKVSGNITNTNYGMQKLREAAHYQLYVFANSCAINVESESTFNWHLLVYAVDAVMALLAALVIWKMILPYYKKSTEKKEK